MYLYATNKRCKIIETAISNIERSLNTNINNIKFASGSANGSSNKKIMGASMTQLYNKYIQKQSNPTEVLKNVFANFVRDLVQYDTEMQNFVTYVHN